MEHPVHVATIVRPHGLRGEMIADGLGTSASVVAALAALRTRAGACWRRWPLRAVRPHGGRLILALDGVDSIEQAEPWRGRELYADAAELPDLPTGTHYTHRLIGLRIEDAAGAFLGRVRGTESGVAQDRLVVETAAGEEALLPMVPAFIKAIEPAAGRIVVDVPEGLLHGVALVAEAERGDDDGEPAP